MRLQRIDFLLIYLRLLKIQRIRRSHHQLLIVLNHVIRAAFEQPYNFFDFIIIFLCRNSTDTTSGASSDMQIKTRAEFPAQN